MDGGRDTSTSTASAPTANQEEAAAAQQGTQRPGTSVDLSDEEQDTAGGNVHEERVRPNHHSSGWSQNSTADSTIDSDHSSLLSSPLSRRSLH